MASKHPESRKKMQTNFIFHGGRLVFLSGYMRLLVAILILGFHLSCDQN